MLEMGWVTAGPAVWPWQELCSISSQHMLQNQESRDVLTSFLLQAHAAAAIDYRQQITHWN